MSGGTGSRLGTTYGVVCTVLTVAGAVLMSLHPQDARSGWPPIVFVGVASAAIGFILLRRRPQERLGWVVASLGALSLLQFLVDAYANCSVHGSRLPAAAYVFVLDEVPSGLLVAQLTLLLLWFPDGRLPGRRWRWTLTVLVAVTVAGLPGRLVRPGPFENLKALVNPIGVHVALLQHATDVANAAGIPLLLVAVVSVFVRWRRARAAVTRDQIKGLAAAAMLWPFTIVALLATPSSFSNSAWGELLFALPTVAMLVAVAVAVLRYRLYDVDRVISRTVASAAVSGVLVAAYVGCVTVATRLLPFSSAVAVAASTLAVAALFNPVRRRVQAAVDHRFNRARYDAGRTVDEFALRLRDEVDPDVVRADLLTVTAGAVQPATLSVWLPTAG